jgi:hypothetical protein
LQYYAQNGWIFGAPEVLMYEHFRKRDQRRIGNLFKLYSIEGSVVFLPGIGEMFRSETKTLKPACTTMRAKGIEFIIQKGASGEYFELDGPSLMSTEQRSRELKVKLRKIIDVWQSLREMPELENASSKEEVGEHARGRGPSRPEIIKELSLKIRNDGMICVDFMQIIDMPIFHLLSCLMRSGPCSAGFKGNC